MREEAMNMQYLMPGTYLTPIAFARYVHAASDYLNHPVITYFKISDFDFYFIFWGSPKYINKYRYSNIFFNILTTFLLNMLSISLIR